MCWERLGSSTWWERPKSFPAAMFTWLKQTFRRKPGASHGREHTMGKQYLCLLTLIVLAFNKDQPSTWPWVTDGHQLWVWHHNAQCHRFTSSWAFPKKNTLVIQAAIHENNGVIKPSTRKTELFDDFKQLLKTSVYPFTWLLSRAEVTGAQVVESSFPANISGSCRTI